MRDPSGNASGEFKEFVKQMRWLWITLDHLAFSAAGIGNEAVWLVFLDPFEFGLQGPESTPRDEAFLL